MKTAITIRAALALYLALACGCQMLPHDRIAYKGHSPLQPAQASPDSVTIDIVWARFPANDPVLDDSAWREIDETQIEPAVRRELINNGLRAGIISGALPAPIARLMREDTTHQAPPIVGDPQAPNKVSASELLNDPVVRGRTRQMRRKERVEIPASDVYPSLPLLVTSGNKELSGRTYDEAQAIYALRVDPKPDRSVQVELTPELHHGQPRLRITGGDEGFIRQTTQKDREIYDRLKVSVKLGASDVLVLMSLPDSGSRLGHYFHTVDSTDGPQQKLILIRLAEVPMGDAFTNL